MAKRVLLKLSGESLQAQQSQCIHTEVLISYAKQIKSIAQQGTEISIVIGGGNIFRGLSGVGEVFDRVNGDQMGMLATIINSIALQSALESINQPATLLTSINMAPIGELYSKSKAVQQLKQGSVVIIGGGTGNPFFTTDSAAALRAVEINADVLLKGTRVDGIYNEDPEKNPNAIRYDEISFSKTIEQKLKIMDLTAFAMCMENSMPIIVFDMDTPGNLEKVINNEKIGTRVFND